MDDTTTAEDFEVVKKLILDNFGAETLQACETLATSIICRHSNTDDQKVFLFYLGCKIAVMTEAGEL